MEILQTIWNVLTNENEFITNFFVIPFAYIESYTYMLLFQSILKLNTNRKQRILYVLIYSSISMINIYLIPSPYYTFINLLVFILCVYFVFKTSFAKSILSIIIVYSATLFIGTPLTLLSMSIFNISSVELNLIPLYRISYCTFFCLSIYGISILLSKYSFKFNIFSKLKKPKLFYFNLLLGIIAIAIQSFLEFKYIDYIPFYLIILSLFILLLYFGISLYSLYRTSKLEITTEKLEEEQLYNKTLTLLYDNIRGFKHDFNNIVQGIGGYISTNNMDGLKKYYSEVLDDCQRVNNLSLLSPEVINNPAIYSLLTSKYHTATECEIKVNLEIFMDLSTINMKIYNLIRVLGILIDNAIEAAKQCEEKEINIIFRKDNRKKQQLFIIENTYTNKNINIDEIFEKGKTSKSDDDSKNHGLGLWEVRQLIRKNKNLNLYTTKTEKYFKQQFEVYC